MTPGSFYSAYIREVFLVFTGRASLAKCLSNMLPTSTHLNECLHCSAGLPHGVNALWLLSEGVSITAGRGAKVNGNHHHEGRS